MARKVVIVYHFFMDALLSEVGREQTESGSQASLWRIGAAERGREMQEMHLSHGLPLNLHSFITYYDDPAAETAWKVKDFQ